MAETLHLKVVTPTGCVVDQPVAAFTASSEVGELCILPGHCLLLGTLVPGRVIVAEPDQQTVLYAVDFGFLEVSPTSVNVITDNCLAASKIDAEKVRAEITQLESDVTAKGAESTEGRLTLRKLDWARARLLVAE